ncbi:MAG: GTPase domain-containing protein [Chloroflexi bacterium]|nr:hypothetical protein [Chloroflexota bacterium]NOG62068.1 GTPase domain-containing protein [Chloroflexota bacterium]
MLSENESNLPASAIALFVIGPFASGRTRFINTLCGRIENYYLDTMPDGKSLMLPFDPTFSITDGKSFYFFDNPSAKRFSSEWLTEQTRNIPPSIPCVIVLFDPSFPPSFREAKSQIDVVANTQIRFLVVANVRDNEDIAFQYESIEAMQKRWGIDKINVCNALDRESVKKVVVELLQMLPAESLTEQAILRVQSL